MPTNFLEFKTPLFEEDVRVSGLPQFHVTFEALGEGGFLGVWLFDEDETGKIKGFCSWNPRSSQSSCGAGLVGHGQMDLRFRDGGDEPQPLVPGQVDHAKMELEPLEILVPKGHRLTAWLFQYQFGDHLASATPAPVRVHMGGSDPTVFRVPTVEVDATEIFPVPGSHPPDPDHYDRFMVAKPMFQNVVPPVNAALAAQAVCLDALRAGLDTSVAPADACAFEAPTWPAFLAP